MDRMTTCYAMVLAMVVGLAGCGQKGPKVQYVEGVVTLDGNPVEGATVGFSPVEKDKGMAALGTTDARGVFKLTTTQGGQPDAGAVVGEYFVSLRKSGSVPVPSAEEMQKLQDDPNYGKVTSGSGPPKPPPVPKAIIPLAYGNPANSGFKVTVKEGKNTGDAFKFDLKSDYRGAGK